MQSDLQSGCTMSCSQLPVTCESSDRISIFCTCTCRPRDPGFCAHLKSTLALNSWHKSRTAVSLGTLKQCSEFGDPSLLSSRFHSLLQASTSAYSWGLCWGHPLGILWHWSEISDMKMHYYKLKCAFCTLMYRVYDLIGIPLY